MVAVPDIPDLTSNAKHQAAHRILKMSRSSIECACGGWSLRLDKTVSLHSGARADYLLDAWLRHKMEAGA